MLYKINIEYFKTEKYRKTPNDYLSNYAKMSKSCIGFPVPSNISDLFTKASEIRHKTRSSSSDNFYIDSSSLS